MQKLLPRLRWAVAAATVLLLVLLGIQCAGLYIAGNSPENTGANGVHIMPVFTMENVRARLQALWPAFLLYALLLAFTLFVQAKYPRPQKSVRPRRPAKQPAPATFRLRVLLYALAALFILLGVWNGGWYDVLVKAINICTECIGLG